MRENKSKNLKVILKREVYEYFLEKEVKIQEQLCLESRKDKKTAETQEKKFA